MNGVEGAIMTTKPFDLGTAILHFFTCLSRNPRGAIWIGVCQLVLVSALALISFVILWPAFADLLELALEDANGTLSESEVLPRVLAILGPFFGFLTLSVPVGIVVALSIQAAWLRFLTKGEVKPVIPFRFGGDEVRLFGVNIMFVVVTAVAYAGLAGLGVVAAVAGAAISKTAAAGVFVVIAGIGLVVLAITAVLMLAVKLASAPALTIRQGEFRFFESWTATNGVFWKMLVSYLAVGVMAMVISSVIGIITQMILLGTFLPFIETVSQMPPGGDPQAAMDLFQTILSSPGTQIAIALALMVSYCSQIIMEAMWHSVGAYNAIRIDDDTLTGTDASRLDTSHPLGASPSEG